MKKRQSQIPKRKSVFALAAPSRSPPQEQEPPIIHAARQKDHLTITSLLDSGSDIESRALQTRRTVLTEAVASGSLASVMLLLERGADIHAVDAEGRSALHLAVSFGRDWLFVTLLKAGAKIDAKDGKGRTALMGAAIAGNVSLVGELLKSGAAMEESDGMGRRAVHFAACLDSDVVLRVLLDAGVEVDIVDDEGDTPLHLAAGCQGSVNVVRLLLSRGAKAFVKNKKGETPAFIALENCRVGGFYHTEVFCVLLKAGGTIAGVWEGEEEEFGMEKALVMVASWGKLVAGDGYGETMKLLIAKCDTLDHRDKEGRSALHWAVQFGCVEIVQGLLKKGANVNLKDNRGRSPLHIAVMGEITDDTKKKEMMVKMLLKYGADARTKDGEGKTPLQRIPWWRSARGMKKAFAEARR